MARGKPCSCEEMENMKKTSSETSSSGKKDK